MFNSRMRKLKTAIRQGDVAQIANIGSQMKFKGEKNYFNACALAIACNNSSALKAVFDVAGHGFWFTNKPESKDRELARKLLNAAFSSANPVPLLIVLYDVNETKSVGRLGLREFLKRDTSVDLVQRILEKNPRYFDVCLEVTGVYSTQNLNMILTFSSNAPEPQPALDQALVQVAGMGELERVKALLERKANPNVDSGRALLRAAEGGHRDMVKLLLPLTEPDLLRDISIQLRQKSGVPEDIIEAIELKYIEPAKQKATAAPQEETASTTNYDKRVDDDTLAEVRTLPDGSTLTTLFNFASEQQLVISDKLGMNPPVSFAQISKAVITAKRKKFDELGEKKSGPSPRSYDHLNGMR